MDLMDELKSLGMNPDEGVQRMGGNSPLYAKMLVRLKDMIKDSPVGMDFDCNDYEDIIEAAHAIKGAAGNLSVTPLYEFYTEFVNLLRGHQPEQAKELLEKALPIQNAFIDCIERHS